MNSNNNVFAICASVVEIVKDLRIPEISMTYIVCQIKDISDKFDVYDRVTQLSYVDRHTLRNLDELIKMCKNVHESHDRRKMLMDMARLVNTLDVIAVYNTVTFLGDTVSDEVIVSKGAATIRALYACTPEETIRRIDKEEEDAPGRRQEMSDLVWP
jgi:hypothetical protein